MKILLSIIAIALATLSLLYYYEVFYFLVENTLLGWVASDVVLRALIIALYAIALFNFSRLVLKQLNSVLLIILSVIVGFGISFIRPIYVDDYGISNGSDFFLKEDFKAKHITTNNLDQGYAVVAFFTTSCPFCKGASYNFSINASKGKQPNTLIFFPGTKEDSENFLKETKSNFSYILIDDQKTFTDNAGFSFPSVYLLKDGTVTYHWIGSEINYSVLDYLASLSN